MEEYANIDVDTMGSPVVYRSTPYQFALTAESGQFVIKYGHEAAGVMRTIPTIIGKVSVPLRNGIFPTVDLKISPAPRLRDEDPPGL